MVVGDAIDNLWEVGFHLVRIVNPMVAKELTILERVVLLTEVSVWALFHVTVSQLTLATTPCQKCKRGGLRERDRFVTTFLTDAVKAAVTVGE
ncbi:MAG: hypothetical protein H6660_18440 [Ardenticatenaceae bacterium]|nr:hypothetical protein [Ardenticatenaceae bacterium]